MSDNDLSDLRRTKIGFVFQSYLLDPRLTVYENVALPAKMARKTERLNERITKLLESLGLADYANQDPTKLSGGQMQRVIIYSERLIPVFHQDYQMYIMELPDHGARQAFHQGPIITE